MKRNALKLTALLLSITTLSHAQQLSTGAGASSIAANTSTTNLNVGIGTSSPIHPLHIRCSDYSGPNGPTGSVENLSARFPNNGILIEKNAGPSGASLYLQYTANSAGRRWGITSGGTGNSGVGNFIITDFTAVADRFTINPSGNVGIAASAPTAKLHVACGGTIATGVRFQNLPVNCATKTLKQVLIDANGNLFVSGVSTASRAANPGNADNAEYSEVEEMKAQIAELQSQIKILLEANARTANTAAVPNKSARLDIYPSPFTNETKVSYATDNTDGNTILQVSDVNGRILKSYPVSNKQGVIQINDVEVSKGLVIFNLISNGKLLASKKSIKQ